MRFRENRITAVSGIWRPFLINISLIILLFLGGIFIGFTVRTDRIIEGQIISTAKAHFQNVVITRRWNAEYGGVYVKKTQGVVSNPYLENPDIETKDGVIYTKKNPALMTREISEYANKSGAFAYHITSLNPLNPGNAADAFETDALNRFEKGEMEIFTTVPDRVKTVFRYMAPLLVEKGCLECHAKQGYQIGDVRGGISVTFDVTGVKKRLATHNAIVVVLSIVTSLCLLAVIFFFVSRLAGKLSDAYHTIEHMSLTDALTGLFNRRHFHTRLTEEILKNSRYKRPLSLLLLDIDHFKRINDTYGHQFGDEVLKGIAELIKSTIRIADVAARYGGEEFVVILPETNEGGAVIAAEKIRRSIEKRKFMNSDSTEIQVTASLGVSSIDMTKDSDSDKAGQLIKLADEALYIAKETGRNRVVSAARAEEAET